VFAGPDYGAFFGLTLTPGGDALAVGSTNHRHVPPYSGDALLVKVTLAGDTLWERTWGGDGYEQAFAVQSAEGGGYYVFGETDSWGAGDRDFFLLKTGEDGAEEWYRTYGRENREWPYGMLSLAGGDLLVFGFSADAAGGRHQYALRLHPDGEVVWEYVGEGSNDELLLGALEAADGTLVLAGSIAEDPVVVALTADGAVTWQRRYELPGWQFASDIAPTGPDGFLLAGFAMAAGPPQQADTWVARGDASGELVWETSFGSPGFDDYANTLLLLRDGTYLMGAISNGLLLTRLDGDGQILWQRSLLGESVHGAMALAEIEEGGFLVAGFIQLRNGESYDAVLVRTDAAGALPG
jgi:outer membrane protein assembly factor BamB